jgi:hypothetical protein
MKEIDGLPEAAITADAATPKSAAFERKISFIPAFDKRDPNPSKNYGIGAVRLLFTLKGPLGATQWLIGTDWYCASAREHLRNFPDRQPAMKPEGWDLGFHGRAPVYDGQSQTHDYCDLTDGPCFYDGSGLNADLLIEGFLTGGEDYVWRALEAYYASTFEGADWPDFKALDAGDAKQSSTRQTADDASGMNQSEVQP